MLRVRVLDTSLFNRGTQLWRCARFIAVLWIVVRVELFHHLELLNVVQVVPVLLSEDDVGDAVGCIWSYCEDGWIS